MAHGLLSDRAELETLFDELASTRNVDSARRFDTDLSLAADRVGSRHDPLVVRTPRPEIIFVMKLYRAQPQDREDLVTLWPRCSFTDPAYAAEAFRTAYPHAPDDEYLAEFITEIATDAASGR